MISDTCMDCDRPLLGESSTTCVQCVDAILEAERQVEEHAEYLERLQEGSD